MRKPIVFEAVLDVNCSDEWFDGPELGQIRLTKDEIERIVEIGQIVCTNRLCSATERSDALTFGNRDDDDRFVSAENSDDPFCLRSHVHAATVYRFGDHPVVIWSGYVKHTNIKLSTSEVGLPQLLEHLDRA